MKKRLILTFILALALVFTVSCGSGGDDYGASRGDYEEDWSGGALGDKYESTSDSLVGETDRKIIKTVTETVETEDYDGFIDSLREAVSAAGGYIANSSFTGGGIYNKDTNRRASFEIRIPAERLSEFTNAVDGIGAVTYYQEGVNDVTLTYVDISSKISVLEAEEAALLEILSKAATTSDLIAIRESLTDVQSELASLRGQKQVLDDRVSYSTVNLTLREVARVKAAEPSFFEEIGGNFAESLENIGGGFRAFAVWLIGDSLYILLVGGALVGGLFLARCLLCRVRANRVKKPEEREEKTEN